MIEHTTKVEPITAGALFEQTCSIPLYQRNYTWGQKEIWQLLDDLWDAFDASPGNFSEKRNYHLGSLTVFPRHTIGGGTEYELIDGQQRTITLGLFLRLLSAHNHAVPDKPMGLSRRLRFENRPEAEMFLASFDANPKLPPANPPIFRGAVDAISDHALFRDEDNEKLAAFAEYVRTRVILFRVEMPPETDVSAYFEIMNNRGIQLEFHDLLKAQLMAKIEGAATRVWFDHLWGACANMGGHLCRRLPKSVRDTLFEQKKSWAVLAESNPESFNWQDVAEKDRSIIPDFPNFLMHVLRRYLMPAPQNSLDTLSKEIPLDERNIRKYFKDHEENIKPVEFLDTLLQTRHKFDRLVVKATDGATDGEREWRLAGNTDWETNENERLRLLHLESMLQVTNPSRREKNWVSLVLCSDKEDACGLIALLEDYVRGRLEGVVQDKGWDNKGTATSHLLLNLIDYLMFCEKPDDYAENNRFRFSYRNTVEHHFPVGSVPSNTDLQTPDTESWTQENVNNIGNLYLLARSDNSGLSVRNPLDKVKLVNHFENLPPKRREMYTLTRDQQKWTPDVMKTHLQRVRELLAAFLLQSKGEEASGAPKQLEV